MAFAVDRIEVIDGLETDLKIDKPVYAIRLGKVLEAEAFVDGVRVAQSDIRCMAYQWIRSYDLRDNDLSIGELRKLAKICKHGAMIRKGEKYIKYYGSDGRFNERWIYCAWPPANDFCVDNNLLVDVC